MAKYREMKCSFLYFVSIKDQFLFRLNLICFLSGPRLRLANQSLTFAQQCASSFNAVVMTVYRILKFHSHAFDQRHPANYYRLHFLSVFSPHTDESVSAGRHSRFFFFFSSVSLDSEDDDTQIHPYDMR